MNFIEIYDNEVRIREATKKGYATAIGGDSINLEQPNSKTRRGRVGKGISNTLTCSCNQGVVIDMSENKIIREIIPMQVRVRKFNVDVESLKILLKESKIKSKLTNKRISSKLDLPLTLVEHWFRSDNSFSIPNDDIWIDLKNILNINTNEFDESIMTFEIRDGVFDKANRVYDSEGIAPTLTCVNAENERYKVYEDMNEIKVIGNYMPSNHDASRIVCDNGIAPTVKENHGTVTGVRQILNNKVDNLNKGVNGMWVNNLEKLNFKMDDIKLFDSFAGKGALHKSLKKLGVPTKVVGLSEVEPDAIIAYAGVHIKGFKDIEFEYPEDKEMREELMSINVGWDFTKQKSSIPRMKKEKLKILYKANKLTNNYGDISQLDYDNLPNFDLFNFSFPCTDISTAGKQRGLINDDGTHTRSGLVKFGIDLIKAKTPKYIMIENVKGLIQNKFINDFYGIINDIEIYGYKCYYATKEKNKVGLVPICLNAKNYGIPQNRERIFVICVRNDCNDSIVEFPKGFDNGIRLKDLLESEVDEKYYLSEEIQKRFKHNGKDDIDRNELNIIGSSAPECRTIGQRDMTYGVQGVMSTLTATDYKQPKQILDSNNVSRLGGCYDTDCRKRQETSTYDDNNICPTLDTMQGGNRQPCVLDKDYFIDKKERKLQFEKKENYIQWDTSGKGYNSQQDRAFYGDGNIGTIPAKNTSDKTNVIENKEYNNFRIRKLTPKECWRLMGFDDIDFDNAKELGLADSSLYKLAGNSIVVNVLYYIFRELFKEYIIK